MYSKVKKWLFTFASTLLLLLLIYTLWPLELSPSAALSVSSDGYHILSTHINGDVVLWDVKQRQGRLIAKNSNSYSACFIKNGRNFMWQDAQARIHVQNTDRSGVFSFRLEYAVKSMTMTTDLTHSYATDTRWTLNSIQSEKQKILKKGRALFQNFDKPLNITLSNDDKYLLTAGAELTPEIVTALSNKKTIVNKTEVTPFEGIILWNTGEGELLHKFSGLVGRVVAAISPDSKYIVGGDEHGNALVWDVASKKALFKLQVPVFDMISQKATLDAPIGFFNKSEDNIAVIFAIKFIDLEGDYLCFFKHIPYAILYNVNDNKPKKYLYLGKNPLFALNDYAYNQTIDTAPAAHILVLGQAKTGGVSVFHYDNKQQNIKKMWDAN